VAFVPELRRQQQTRTIIFLGQKLAPVGQLEREGASHKSKCCDRRSLGATARASISRRQLVKLHSAGSSWTHKRAEVGGKNCSHTRGAWRVSASEVVNLNRATWQRQNEGGRLLFFSFLFSSARTLRAARSEPQTVCGARKASAEPQAAHWQTGARVPAALSVRLFCQDRRQAARCQLADTPPVICFPQLAASPSLCLSAGLPPRLSLTTATNWPLQTAPPSSLPPSVADQYASGGSCVAPSCWSASSNLGVTLRVDWGRLWGRRASAQWAQWAQIEWGA